MIKRVVIDNYKCFDHFEIELGRNQLLLGDNGSGKTALFEVIDAVARLIASDGQVRDLFGANTRCRWRSATRQTISLTVEIGRIEYEYHLAIDHDVKANRVSITSERLVVNGTVQYEVEQEIVNWRWKNEEFRVGLIVDSDQGSWLGTVVMDPADAPWPFVQALKQTKYLRFHPHVFEGETVGPSEGLARNVSNFASWLLGRIPDGGGVAYAKLQKYLACAIPGFQSIGFRQVTQKSRILELGLRFGDAGVPYQVEFTELSDGQKMLVVLYSLLCFGASSNSTLLLDEPDGFLALPEIQPWLQELEAEENLAQVLIISHHPELIDYYGSEGSLWFTRDESGAAQARAIQYDGDEPLTLSELVARGRV